MAKSLITGINGFTGQHLAQHLLAHGEYLFGLSPVSVKLPFSVSRLYLGDIRDRATLKTMLGEVQPDVIYHLAGLLKATDLEAFYQVNVLGTIALFEVIIELGLRPTVVVASSSAVYGKGFGCRPISQCDP